METRQSYEPYQAQPEENTSRELLEALEADEELQDLLDEETSEFIADCEFGEALGYVYGLLINQSYDPDSCLERIGILEPNIGTG